MAREARDSQAARRGTSFLARMGAAFAVLSHVEGDAAIASLLAGCAVPDDQPRGPDPSDSVRRSK